MKNRRMREEEMVRRFLERCIIRFTIALAIVTAGVLYWGKLNLQAIEQIEKNLGVDKEYIYSERKSLKETTREYIDSLPMSSEESISSISVPVLGIEEKNEESYIDYTDEDVEFLAQLMYAEEGVFFRQWAEDPETVERVHKLAGSVVIHRLDNNYKNASTIQEVVFCKGQYADTTLERVRKGQEMPDIVFVWAEELLRDGPIGPNNLIYQSEFLQGEKYEIIGNQYFGTDPAYSSTAD